MPMGLLSSVVAGTVVVFLPACPGTRAGRATFCLAPDNRVVVFVDYQNLCHSARASFFEGADPPVQAGHVHTLRVGELLCDLGRGQESGRVLAGVRVHWAVPDVRSGADLERATKIQMARWASTSGVKVCARPMDYIETTRRGREDWVGRGKGINVMLAVDLVDMARTGAYDAAVVFSADTDLPPALEAVVRIGERIETVTWRVPGDSRGPLRNRHRSLRNHYLDHSCFDLARDDADFLKPPF